MKNMLLIEDDLRRLADLAVTLIEAGYQFIPTMDPEPDIAFIQPPQLMIFPYFLFG